VYVAAYTFGRFFVEWLRIDSAHRFFGLRLNDWTSIVVFVAAVVWLLWSGPRSSERTAEHLDV
jgi:prolipoprotein diacylglyceryltransferase